MIPPSVRPKPALIPAGAVTDDEQLRSAHTMIKELVLAYGRPPHTAVCEALLSVGLRERGGEREKGSERGREGERGLRGRGGGGERISGTIFP